ncbi:uncharacterized protein LOC133920764 [Phragmites australis]|uniref:uncharacterized protein LOC133920764 n=1 Tax=Phragmites australis TaxID=29695 RepID=UPI002D775D03|nr:uncharacterized protein LOC133920764 [Phragmites australis]
MATPMVSRKRPSFLALVPAALFVSSCYASRDAPGDPWHAGPNGIVIQDDPKCEVMVPCNRLKCYDYCLSIGLEDRGFCTFKPDLQFYCCCRVPASPGA